MCDTHLFCHESFEVQSCLWPRKMNLGPLAYSCNTLVEYRDSDLSLKLYQAETFTCDLVCPDTVFWNGSFGKTQQEAGKPVLPSGVFKPTAVSSLSLSLWRGESAELQAIITSRVTLGTLSL